MFELINNIKKNKEKKFFIEKVNIYLKYTNLITQSLNLKTNFVNDQLTHKTVLELRNLNIIKSKNNTDIDYLNKILKKELYSKFLSSINFNIKNRKKIGNLLDIFISKKKIKNSNKNFYTIADFFCGAGGLSYGFSQENFKIQLANDNDEECIETYKLNHPDVPKNKVIQEDIKTLIKKKIFKFHKKIDVVVGGPPCQGFSNVNQQRIIDDPRNKLYKYFVQAVKKINPKIVVMENVKGMYPYAEQVKEDFENISYTMTYDILVSDQFGVAQKRPRLFFIGIREDIIKKKKLK